MVIHGHYAMFKKNLQLHNSEEFINRHLGCWENALLRLIWLGGLRLIEYKSIKIQAYEFSLRVTP